MFSLCVWRTERVYYCHCAAVEFLSSVVESSVSLAVRSAEAAQQFSPSAAAVRLLYVSCVFPVPFSFPPPFLTSISTGYFVSTSWNSRFLVCVCVYILSIAHTEKQKLCGWLCETTWRHLRSVAENFSFFFWKSTSFPLLPNPNVVASLKRKLFPPLTTIQFVWELRKVKINGHLEKKKKKTYKRNSNNGCC